MGIERTETSKEINQENINKETDICWTYCKERRPGFVGQENEWVKGPRLTEIKIDRLNNVEIGTHHRQGSSRGPRPNKVENDGATGHTGAKFD